MRLVKSGTERIVSHFTCCYATTCTISVCWTKIGENKKCKDQMECLVFVSFTGVLRILVKIVLDEKNISLRVHSHLRFIRHELIVE